MESLNKTFKEKHPILYKLALPLIPVYIAGTVGCASLIEKTEDNHNNPKNNIIKKEKKLSVEETYKLIKKRAKAYSLVSKTLHKASKYDGKPGLSFVDQAALIDYIVDNMQASKDYKDHVNESHLPFKEGSSKMDLYVELSKDINKNSLIFLKIRHPECKDIVGTNIWVDKQILEDYLKK